MWSAGHLAPSECARARRHGGLAWHAQVSRHCVPMGHGVGLTGLVVCEVVHVLLWRLMVRWRCLAVSEQRHRARGRHAMATTEREGPHSQSPVVAPRCLQPLGKRRRHQMPRLWWRVRRFGCIAVPRRRWNGRRACERSSWSHRSLVGRVRRLGCIAVPRRWNGRRACERNSWCHRGLMANCVPC
jgi:hypothetical protein